jgi:oxygen-independent coproporphyrinogen-3 oxidase
MDDVRATAERACALAPQRIALFGYAHVPWFKKQQQLIEVAELPRPAERLAQAEAARAVFLSAGYQPVGFDHFALPADSLAIAARTGRLHRNFQGYTSDDADALIGIGASSIGRLPQGYVQNAPDVGGYARAVGAGRLATVKGLAFTEDDRLRSQIIERIMCDLRLDLDAVAAPAGTDFSDELLALKPLAGEGLVRIDGPLIVVTERGRPFVRLIAAVFDRYLQASRRPHSLAV